MNNLNNLGWVFIYIFSFGISDYIEKKYIKSDVNYIKYYILIAIIGNILILQNSWYFIIGSVFRVL